MTRFASRTLRSWGWSIGLTLALLLVLTLSGCALETQSWSAPASDPGQAPQAIAANVQASEQQAGVTSSAAVTEDTGQPTSEPMAFRGAVETLPAGGSWEGTWRVGGHAVRVAPSTSVDQQGGRPEPGSKVEVEGWQQPDGTLNAGWVRVVASNAAAPAAERPAAVPAAGDSLSMASGVITPTAPLPGSTPAAPVAPAAPVVPDKGSPSRWITETVHPIEFRGIVGMLPGNAITGTWQVNGHTVNVSAGTDLKLQLGAIKQGAYVQIIGWLQPDGTVNAAKILVKKYQPGKGNKEAGKAPDVSGAPEVSSTPEAGETPEVEGTPALGSTPAADTTPAVSMTPSAGDTEQDQDDEGGRKWDVRVHGQVEVVTDGPGTWVVDGQRVTVDAETWLKAKQALAEGSWVQVKGFLQPDGSILATSIQWVHRTPDTRTAVEPSAPGTPQVSDKDKGKGKSALVTPAVGKGKSPKLAATPAPRPQTPGKSQNQGRGNRGRGGNTGQGNGTGQGKGPK